ncbi:MAG TPA: RNA polymerase sigma-54 factor, partial [Tissierellaceae bacterium]|nr:RNA polymerase sigma-54 factor [Tissierellaceae bacterium]
MKLSYNLTLEQSQKLIMTPELKQAIQLLQYNSLELNEYLSNEIQENPLLEMETPKVEVENVDKDNIKEPEIDWKEYLEQYDDYSYRPQVDKNQKEYTIEAFTSYDLTLREHLITQLTLVKLSPDEYKIGEYIIQSLDENGYLYTA